MILIFLMYHRTGKHQAGDGDCCGRISQCVVDRCCRRREIHAREASADDPATDELRRKFGSDKDIQCRRDVTAGRGIDTQTSVQGTTSHNLGICTDRWRQGSDTRGGELCTLWGACFWTNFRNFPNPCWKCCASLWKTVESGYRECRRSYNFQRILCLWRG